MPLNAIQLGRCPKYRPINDTKAGVPLLGDLTVGFQVGLSESELGRIGVPRIQRLASRPPVVDVSTKTHETSRTVLIGSH